MRYDIQVKNSNFSVLVPVNGDKDSVYRLKTYSVWLDETGRHWHQLDLEAYRDYLLNDYEGRKGKPLATSSVKAHLATIKGRYDVLLKDNAIRDQLYSLSSQDASPSDRKAVVDEILQRIENGISEKTARVKIINKQDVDDSKHVRLTSEQASALIAAPGTDTLKGLRDTTAIALMLCTGIREAELCALRVDDLRHHLGGELALLVREGKGSKQRLIPYGELSFVLAIVDAWLDSAGITEGAFMRGFYNGAKRIRDTHMVKQAVNQLLKRYPVMIDGKRYDVRPHDLRRTYARRLYEAGVDLLAISSNLGHADTKTTLNYIGELDGSARRPPSVYTFNLGDLKLLQTHSQR